MTLVLPVVIMVMMVGVKGIRVVDVGTCNSGSGGGWYLAW